ncbi:hypothetical protein MMC24_004399 [Lignoscripta atroalba]|nr:hypothetical protein [Lignoscripta atroalba]
MCHTYHYTWSNCDHKESCIIEPCIRFRHPQGNHPNQENNHALSSLDLGNPGWDCPSCQKELQDLSKESYSSIQLEAAQGTFEKTTIDGEYGSAQAGKSKLGESTWENLPNETVKQGNPAVIHEELGAIYRSFSTGSSFTNDPRMMVRSALDSVENPLYERGDLFGGPAQLQSYRQTLGGSNAFAQQKADIRDIETGLMRRTFHQATSLNQPRTPSQLLPPSQSITLDEPQSPRRSTVAGQSFQFDSPSGEMMRHIVGIGWVPIRRTANERARNTEMGRQSRFRQGRRGR